MLVVNSYKNTGVLTVTKHNGINFTIRQFLLVFDLYFLSRILLSSRLKEGYVGPKATWASETSLLFRCRIYELKQLTLKAYWTVAPNQIDSVRLGKTEALI